MTPQRTDLFWGRPCPSWGHLSLTIAVNSLWLALAAVPAHGQAVIATVPAGMAPTAVAVNPVTNKIYVANGSSNNVTVIDGATNSTTTVTDPNAVYPTIAVAVNPVTNKIYVANGNNVTVIDGATNATTTVTDPNAMNPVDVAVNPVTDKIYVANSGSNNVTVIDGATNAITSVTISPITTVGYPIGCCDAVAVNPLTNRIYVASVGFVSPDGSAFGGTVTVIDGPSNGTTTVYVGNGGHSVAVNLATNKTYVTNYGFDAYYASDPGNVTVIDGATESTTTVTDPNAVSPIAVAVNSVTNKIYVVNFGSNNVTVIDGATNSTTTVTDSNASGPIAVAVNPLTDKTYVTNQSSNNVTVIGGAGGGIIPVSLSATRLSFASQNVGTTGPGQNVTVTNQGSSPLAIASPVTNGDFSAHKLCPNPVKAGAFCKINVAFKPTQTGVRSGTLAIIDSDPTSPQIVALTGTGTAPAVSLSNASLNFAGQLVDTSSAAQTVTLTNRGDGPLTISSVTASGDFTATPGQCAGKVAAGASCEITVVFKPQAGGSRTGSLSIADDAANTPQAVNLSGAGQDFAVAASTTSATVTAGQTASYTLSLASQGGFSGAVSLTCAGAPSAAACSLTPSSVTIEATGATPVTVRVTTTAGSMALRTDHRHPPGLASPRMLLLASLIVLSALAFTRVGSMAPRRTPLGALLLLVMLWVGCGGGMTSGPSPAAGTPAGTYTLMVAASGFGLTNNISLTLVVNP